MNNHKVYLTSKQIYKIDKITTEKFLIPSFVLMENAGRSVAEFVFIYLMKRNKNRKVLIFCGPGKNGGDGFVCARYLSIWGIDLKVVVFTEEYKDDVLRNYLILKKLKLPIIKFEVDKIKKLLKKCDVIIDAIFGIGVSRNIEGIYKEAIELINHSKRPVVSIDIPSGINADTGKVMGVAVKADFTLTMGFLKICFRKRTVKKFLGRVVVFDIGYPKMLIEKL